MSLLIKGFKKQKTISIDEVVSAINELPKSHILGLTSVVYDPNRFYQRSYVTPKPINYGVAGEYNSGLVEHILIYKFKNKFEFKHILFHEIGHHVFRCHLNSTQRKTWVTGISPKSTYVSDYAKTNANEDFAESYAYYFTDQTYLANVSTSKLHFLKGNLWKSTLFNINPPTAHSA